MALFSCVLVLCSLFLHKAAGTLSIVTHPQPKSVFTGDDVTFTCNATALAAPSIWWQKDGVNITISDGSTLNLVNVKEGDSGNYTCVAEAGENTTTSDAAFLSVKLPPVITNHPANQTANKDENVTIACSANGTEPFNVIWLKNNEVYDFSSDSRVHESHNNLTLEIFGVLPNDHGSYQCDVSNGRTDKSYPGTLIVKYAPQFIVEPKGKTTTEGQVVKFECQTTGNPSPNVTWLKSGSAVNTSVDPRFYSNDTILMITNVSRIDSGTYSCNASNELGIISAEAALDVRYGPEFVNVPQDKTPNEGWSVTFECHTKGNPPPTVTWLKNGSALNTSVDPRFYSNGTHLMITNVNRTDSGAYRCNASSILGVITTKASLDVYCYEIVDRNTSCHKFAPDPPMFKKQPLSQTVIEGDKASFTCPLEGNPPPHVTWWRHGFPLSPADLKLDISYTTLTIVHVSRFDYGYYHCSGANTVGVLLSSSALLNVDCEYGGLC